MNESVECFFIYVQQFMFGTIFRAYIYIEETHNRKDEKCMKPTLTDLQKNFVELMLDERMYTNVEMAEMLGCSERAIYKMKRTDKVVQAIEEGADTALKASLNRAYGVLTDILFSEESSENSKLKALDLFLKTQGKLKDKSETDITIAPKSTEQASAELDRLLGL